MNEGAISLVTSDASRDWQRCGQQALIQQAETFLEQLIAALGITQLSEQTCQLCTGFRITLHAQTAFQIIPCLAPQTGLQTQTPQGQQQARIIRMILEPAFGGLQLTRRITASHQAIQTRQMAVVSALECRAQHFFRLHLRAQLTQLFGIGQHQRRFLTLRRSELLPGPFKGLQTRLAILLALRRQRQVFTPGAALKLSQFSGRQDLVLAQFRQ